MRGREDIKLFACLNWQSHLGRCEKAFGIQTRQVQFFFADGSDTGDRERVDTKREDKTNQDDMTRKEKKQDTKSEATQEATQGQRDNAIKRDTGERSKIDF